MITCSYLKLIITPQQSIENLSDGVALTRKGVMTMKKASKMAACTVFDHASYEKIEKTVKSAMRLAGYRSQFNKQDCQDYLQNIMVRLCTLTYEPQKNVPVDCFVRMVVKGELINIINSKNHAIRSVTDYFEGIKGQEWYLDSIPCYKSNHPTPLDILLKEELWANADPELVKKYE